MKQRGGAKEVFQPVTLLLNGSKVFFTLDITDARRHKYLLAGKDPQQHSEMVKLRNVLCFRELQTIKISRD